MRPKTQDPKRKIARQGALLVFFCLVAMVSCLFSGLAAEAPQDFQEANLLYKQGKFNEAADLYEKLILTNSYLQYAELRFNLGNAQFRLGKISEAIYNYERALALNPFYTDARYNLNQARAKIQYKIDDKRNLFIRFNDLILKWVKPTQLFAMVLIFLLIFLVSLALWLRRSDSQPIWTFPRGEIFTLCVCFAILLALKVYFAKNYAEAIVLSEEAEVRYGPSMDNQSLMKLGGGLKVYVVDAREDWSRVLTLNGETGWMKNSDIGRVSA